MCREEETAPSRSRREPPGAALAGLLLALLAAALAGAGATPPPAPERGEPDRGAVLYQLHCASCHGREGRGDGPLAEQLKSRPPDLTRIAARRGGRFPATEIERIIDGRLPVEPHGRAEMPIWGLSFRQPGRIVDQEEEVWLQIRLLVRHLRSIQAGPVIDDGPAAER